MSECRRIFNQEDFAREVAAIEEKLNELSDPTFLMALDFMELAKYHDLSALSTALNNCLQSRYRILTGLAGFTKDN